jgi:RNA polymerase sigma-70 factor (ECF subfamily)
MTSDQAVLDDLTQITFIKAWKNIKRFDQEKNFKVWLFTIAKNTAYDYFKKKKAIPFSDFIDAEGNNRLEEVSEVSVLPEDFLDQQNLSQVLESKLEEISAPYGIILLMHYKDDFSLAEIAEILGKPYNTVKSQHNRALKALKNTLTASASG